MGFVEAYGTLIRLPPTVAVFRKNACPPSRLSIMINGVVEKQGARKGAFLCSW
jgi:hypothetical protein